jgi:lipopolysaccharide/colanic/teichoic acid biosynthesis glycosyltransferase
VDVGAQPAPGALGVLADLGSILLERGAECVVVCGHLEDQEFRGIVESARDAGCHLFSVPRAFRIVGVEPKLVWRHGQPLIELTSPAVKGQELVVKRLLDFLLSLAGLVLLAPVFLLVATAIKLDSPGPVFYRPWRRGRFWQPYRMWKFRSMVVDADERLEQDPTMRAEYAINIKLVRDPRVTRVGRLIRKWSADELPQLFNVLIGEMSLVGPRPKALGEEARYGAAADTVLAVRPGITGLWQISGRCATTYDERIALEVRYASRPSLWGDLEILLRTVPVVLKGTGAH